MQQVPEAHNFKHSKSAKTELASKIIHTHLVLNIPLLRSNQGMTTEVSAIISRKVYRSLDIYSKSFSLEYLHFRNRKLEMLIMY